MIGCRATVGLSLLCALLFCALAAQGALGANKGTTAFTCSSTATVKDFADAHCDKAVNPGEGKFGHVKIEKDVSTELEITNLETKSETKERFPAKFAVKGLFKVNCNTVTGTATAFNFENLGAHFNLGGKIQVDYTACEVTEPELCKVKEPIEVKGAGSITSTGESVNEDEMGVTIHPAEEKPFAEVTFEGEGCKLKGKKFKIEGIAVGTGARGTTEKPARVELHSHLPTQ